VPLGQGRVQRELAFLPVTSSAHACSLLINAELPLKDGEILVEPSGRSSRAAARDASERQTLNEDLKATLNVVGWYVHRSRFQRVKKLVTQSAKRRSLQGVRRMNFVVPDL
jgi:hypothetical protein